MTEGWKPGKEMLTVLKSMNQCKYVDWSVVVDPVKSGDDAVAKKNSYSVVIAPPLVACGWNPGTHGKIHVSLIFTCWRNNHKEPRLEDVLYQLTALTVNQKASFYDNSLGLLRSA